MNKPTGVKKSVWDWFHQVPHVFAVGPSHWRSLSRNGGFGIFFRINGWFRNHIVSIFRQIFPWKWRISGCLEYKILLDCSYSLIFISILLISLSHKSVWSFSFVIGSRSVDVLECGSIEFEWSWWTLVWFAFRTTKSHDSWTFNCRCRPWVTFITFARNSLHMQSV